MTLARQLRGPAFRLAMSSLRPAAAPRENIYSDGRGWGAERSCLAPFTRSPGLERGIASMTLIGAMVGITFESLKPLAVNSLRYSASVRSLPPDMTSMLRSSKLANETSLEAGSRLSITRCFPRITHRPPAVVQGIIVPVTGHIFQDIRVGAAGDRLPAWINRWRGFARPML